MSQITIFGNVGHSYPGLKKVINTKGKIGNVIEQHEINVTFRRFCVLVEGFEGVKVVNKNKTISFIAWKETLSDTETRPENLLVPAGGGARTSKFEGRIEVSESSFRYKGYSFLFIYSFKSFN